MNQYQRLLKNSKYQEKFRKKLMQRHGNEIINDFALARSVYGFKLSDIAAKYGFTRERARQLFGKLYREPYRFYQKILYNDRIRGKRFGKLTAMEHDDNGTWFCVCDCGKTKVVPGHFLLQNTTMSCGCALKAHGMANTKAYTRWANMLGRCRNKTHPQYKYYGARGIAVCEEWLDFKNFYKDMGDCPDGLTIERVNNNGNYEPSNCKWGTYKEQANNRRQRESAVLLEFKGEQFNISQWARKMGLKPGTLAQRVRAGWPTEKALTEPLQIQIKGETP